MLKNYTLGDGFTFDTITIPKGTLLFRGIQFSNLTPREHIKEFVNRGSCIPPTKNVYFYPVPYAAIAINNYNIHILYTTNYDLELLLLVRPAKGFKPDASEEEAPLSRILTICTNISNHDKCGNTMQEDDPCFTDFFLDNFPHIMGYVGLDAGDVDSFFGRYRAMIRANMKNEISQIFPALVENSRDIIGIPEIVIHPLHLRRNKVIRVKRDFNNPNYQIKSIIANRARWNYTPLLYVSRSDIFSLIDLLNYDNINTLRQTKSPAAINDNPLFHNLNKVMKGLASSDGFMVGEGGKYKIKLDLRTGFYMVVNPTGKKNNTRRNRENTSTIFEFVVEDGSANTDIKETPVKYRTSKILPDGIINNIKYNYLMDMNEDYVNKYLHSFLSYSVLERGNFIKKYRLDEVFSRPDISKN